MTARFRLCVVEQAGYTGKITHYATLRAALSFAALSVSATSPKAAAFGGSAAPHILIEETRASRAPATRAKWIGVPVAGKYVWQRQCIGCNHAAHDGSCEHVLSYLPVSRVEQVQERCACSGVRS